MKSREVLNGSDDITWALPKRSWEVLRRSRGRSYEGIGRSCGSGEIPRNPRPIRADYKHFEGGHETSGGGPRMTEGSVGHWVEVLNQLRVVLNHLVAVLEHLGVVERHLFSSCEQTDQYPCSL